jgi:hypothetical protein
MQLLIPRLGLIALAAGFNYLVWLWVGSISFAVCSPLYACIVARPVIELLSGSYGFTRHLAFRKISGGGSMPVGMGADQTESGNEKLSASATGSYASGQGQCRDAYGAVSGSLSMGPREHDTATSVAEPGWQRCSLQDTAAATMFLQSAGRPP